MRYDASRSRSLFLNSEFILAGELADFYVGPENMSFDLSIIGESDDWMINNRGVNALLDLLRMYGKNEKAAKAFEVATFFNGIEIDMQVPDDVEIARTVIRALNPSHLDEMEVDLATRFQELAELLDRAVVAHSENTLGYPVAGLDGFGVVKFSQGCQVYGNQLSRRDS